MTSRDFCYWLQGYFEIGDKVPQPPEPHGGYGLNGDQLECIKRHLAMVFVHEIDPSFGGPEKQAKLDAAHAPTGNPLIDHPKSKPSALGGTGPGGVLYRC